MPITAQLGRVAILSVVIDAKLFCDWHQANIGYSLVSATREMFSPRFGQTLGSAANMDGGPLCFVSRFLKRGRQNRNPRLIL